MNSLLVILSILSISLLQFAACPFNYLHLLWCFIIAITPCNPHCLCCRSEPAGLEGPVCQHPAQLPVLVHHPRHHHRHRPHRALWYVQLSVMFTWQPLFKTFRFACFYSVLYHIVCRLIHKYLLNWSAKFDETLQENLFSDPLLKSLKWCFFGWINRSPTLKVILQCKKYTVFKLSIPLYNRLPCGIRATVQGSSQHQWLYPLTPGVPCTRQLQSR